MTLTAHTEPDIHELVNQLTREHPHAEPYTVRTGETVWQRRHPTKVPALIHQLLEADPRGSREKSGALPASRPAARIDALDTAIYIDDQAGRWISTIGDNPPRDTYDPRTLLPQRGSGTIARVIRVHVLHASLTQCGKRTGRRDSKGAWCCTAHHLEYDVRRWWRSARIVTGWDSPAYRPFATCPVCEHRGGLRIRLDIRSALCVECRAVWDPDTLGLLAEHIRTENDTPNAEVHA